MQNNLSLLLKNKYFFALCLYLKTNLSTTIYTKLFIGYKKNYLILNISILIRILKLLIKLIQQIANQNGTFLFLATNNKILDYIIQKNCLRTNDLYLNLGNKKNIKTLKYLPDLIISTNVYSLTSSFINEITMYNIPLICVTHDIDFIQKSIYTLIINNQSLYSNLILYTLFFNQILQTKKKLGVQYLSNNL